MTRWFVLCAVLAACSSESDVPDYEGWTRREMCDAAEYRSCEKTVNCNRDVLGDTSVEQLCVDDGRFFGITDCCRQNGGCLSVDVVAAQYIAGCLQAVDEMECTDVMDDPPELPFECALP